MIHGFYFHSIKYFLLLKLYQQLFSVHKRWELDFIVQTLSLIGKLGAIRNVLLLKATFAQDFTDSPS